MVTAVTNLGRSGLYDWLVQRVSGVVLLAYFSCLAAFLISTPDVSYEQWHGLFQHTAMRVFSVAAILSLAMHAWIGLWCVVTDYLTPRLLGPRANLYRGLASAVCGITLFTYVVWGLQIVWGS
ncbi:MAG: succinate dehydrogenase, hydrophobic membrane anchor protein [Halieaceae bacterium]